jgi:hypothetical protein
MQSRTSCFITAAAAFALLVALTVPANAQWAIGGMLTLQSQDRQHELTLQTKLAVNARFGSQVIGSAHFGVVPSVTTHVTTDFLFTPDNFEFRDTRNDFGFVTFIPVTGPEVCERLRPHYSDTKGEDRRQPDSFRFSLPAGSLQPAMTYSVKMTLNLAKSSRTFVIFFKRGTQKGDVSFSLNVRDVQAPQNAFDAFKQLDGFSLLIDDQPDYNVADGNGQQNDGQGQNAGDDRTGDELAQEERKLLRAHSELLATQSQSIKDLHEGFKLLTEGFKILSKDGETLHKGFNILSEMLEKHLGIAKPKGNESKPAEAPAPIAPTLKAFMVEICFRDADGKILNRDGEGIVTIDGREELVVVKNGKGSTTVDLDPCVPHTAEMRSRVAIGAGWTSWSTKPACTTYTPGGDTAFRLGCRWTTTRRS